MSIPKAETINTAEQARALAVEWQSWQSARNISYGELFDWQVFFSELLEKFPELVEEFTENGIL